MYCFIKYTVPDPTLPLITESMGSIFSRVSNIKVDYKELIVNPNCHVQILLDYICAQIPLEKNGNFDFCDGTGILTYIQDLKPYDYATDVLRPLETYYIVLFEKDINGTVVNIEILLDKKSKVYTELLYKIRRLFQLGSKLLTDFVGKTRPSGKSKASLSSTTNSTSSTRPKSVSKTGIKVLKSASSVAIK